MRQPSDSKWKVGTNVQYVARLWIDLTSWLLGMNFSSEHTKWKNSHSHIVMEVSKAVGRE